jgi:hypothetical protein
MTKLVHKSLKCYDVSTKNEINVTYISIAFTKYTIFYYHPIIEDKF